MSNLTVKKLLIYTAFLFVLNGCGAGSSGGGSGSDSGASGVSVVQKGDGTALLSWTPPTENTDNSALTDLAGYKIYYGTFSGDYDNTITIDNEGLSSYLVEELAAVDWCFVVTAFNLSGIESAYSIEVCKSIE
jgi:hypothetical protein